MGPRTQNQDVDRSHLEELSSLPVTERIPQDQLDDALRSPPFVDLPGALNMRDLGCAADIFTSENGPRIKQGFLLRSGTPILLPSESIHALVGTLQQLGWESKRSRASGESQPARASEPGESSSASGIGVRIFDLRSERERASMGRLPYERMEGLEVVEINWDKDPWLFRCDKMCEEEEISDSEDGLGEGSASMVSPDPRTDRETTLQGRFPRIAEESIGPRGRSRRYEKGAREYARVFEDHLDIFKTGYKVVFDWIRDIDSSNQEEIAMFHCTAGKDRTGTLSALILDLAGVPPEAIAADFALTRIGMESHHELLIGSKIDGLGDSPDEKETKEGLISFQTPSKGRMLLCLKLLHRKYEGGAKGYLMEELGYPEEDVERMRRNLLVD